MTRLDKAAGRGSMPRRKKQPLGRLLVCAVLGQAAARAELVVVRIRSCMSIGRCGLPGLLALCAKTAAACKACAPVRCACAPRSIGRTGTTASRECAAHLE